MKKLVLFGAILASGCDDPEAAGRAAELLELGLVRASLHCTVEGQTKYWPNDCVVSDTHSLTVKRLADGAAFVRFNEAAFLFGRAEPEAESLDLVYSLNEITLGAGIVTSTFLGNEFGACDPIVVDIESECSGYNLEAFGVE